MAVASTSLSADEKNTYDVNLDNLDKVDKVDTVEHLEASDNMSTGNLGVMQHTTPLMISMACFIALGGFVLNFDLGYTGLVLVMGPFKKAFWQVYRRQGR
jgi:hypothetical protein